MSRRHDWNRLSRDRAVCRWCGVERWRFYAVTDPPGWLAYTGGYCGELHNPKRPPPCIVPERHGPRELAPDRRAGLDAFLVSVGQRTWLHDRLEPAPAPSPRLLEVYRTMPRIGEGAR